MNVLQTTIEKLLYYVLSLMFVALILIGVLVVHEDRQINHILNNHSSTIQTIEDNQKTNSTAIKDYIACLLKIDYTNTAQIPNAEQACFSNAPGVK